MKTRWDLADSKIHVLQTNFRALDSKIWALAISKDENTIISGSADSVVTFWADCTDEMKIEKENARAEIILKCIYIHHTRRFAHVD